MLLSIRIAQLLLCPGDVDSNSCLDKRLDKILSTLEGVITFTTIYQTQTLAEIEQINSGIIDISANGNFLKGVIRL